MKTLFTPAIIILLSLSALDVYAQGLHALQSTTQSPITAFVSNYGVLFQDVYNVRAGLIFPRNSQNQYVAGGGLWFAAQKNVGGKLNSLVEVSYNPSTTRSWMTPGNVSDGDTTAVKDYPKFAIENSSDFNRDGTRKNAGLPWSLWKTNSGTAFTGFYESTIAMRNSAVYPKGASFFSDEMFHSRYKDTDLSRFEGGSVTRKAAGYPLRLQVDERVFTSRAGEMSTCIIVQNSITNTSSDTLFQCWIATVLDPDIGLTNNPSTASNDYARYVSEEKDLHAAIVWTGTGNGEQGKGFGYLGISLLETPSVENNSLNTLIESELALPLVGQKGLVTFKILDNNIMPIQDKERYDVLSASSFDEDNTARDCQLIMASGPVTMLPGQTMRFAYCLALAAPVGTTEADGTSDNASGIKDLLTKVRDYYYDDLTTDIEENNNNIEYNIYPNPTNNIVNVYTELNNGTIMNVYLVDILGNKYQMQYSLSNSSLQFSVLNIPSGMYSVIINNSKKGTVIVTK